MSDPAPFTTWIDAEPLEVRHGKPVACTFDAPGALVGMIVEDAHERGECPAGVVIDEWTVDGPSPRPVCVGQFPAACFAPGSAGVGVHMPLADGDVVTVRFRNLLPEPACIDVRLLFRKWTF